MKPNKVLLCNDDMTYLATVTKHGSRKPTKWEVLRCACILLRYRSKGKGSARKLLSSVWTKFRAATWKAGQVSSAKEMETAPELFTSASDTRCRPPQSGQTI